MGLALVVCLCVGVVGTAGGLGYLGYRLDKADAVAALREYLEDVSAGNYPAAYDRLCDKAKAGVTRDDYVKRFPAPRPVAFELGEASMSARDGEDGYDVEAELRLADGRTRTETYFVFSTFSDMSTYYVCP